MGSSNSSKIRLLRLLEILTEKTDEDHPMETAQLLDELAKWDITAERKSIYRDMEALRSVGLDVIFTRTPKCGYFLGERRLQVAEIRLLMDGVLSAGFITHKKSMELVNKLTGTISCYQAAELKNQLYIDHRNKQQNEEIYYTVDIVNRAIVRRKKICFSYNRRILDETGAIRWSTRTFTVSPYALLWYDDRYYLIGNNEKYDNLMHLRVDRMRHVLMLKENCRSFEEVSAYRGHFDVADYAAKLSNAFGGTAMSVELVCEPELLETVLDRFGQEIDIRRRPDHRFSFRVKMAVSDGLVKELLNFGTGIEVVSPKMLREKMQQTVSALYQMYQD